MAVTEQEWLAGTDPQEMLEFLRGKASDRKFRLYLCESYRTMPSGRLPENIRKAILVMERYAEGLACRKELLDARSRAWESVIRFAEQQCRSRLGATSEDLLHHARLAAIARGTSPDIDGIVGLAIPQLLQLIERPHQLSLLHDIFGNPFRPVVISPAVLAWNGGTVVRLAQAAYDERQMPAGTLDSGRLAVLADALEEAGCSDERVLRHLRSSGKHYRGCFVVDLLLGKA
jgi:hypothetical protein